MTPRPGGNHARDLLDDPAWMVFAACTGLDPDLFFPQSRGPGAGREAKAVCAGCQVRSDCLEYALDRDYGAGVWGGLNERERRTIRRRRARP